MHNLKKKSKFLHHVWNETTFYKFQAIAYFLSHFLPYRFRCCIPPVPCDEHSSNTKQICHIVGGIFVVLTEIASMS
jgi:hypothetical protein